MARLSRTASIFVLGLAVLAGALAPSPAAAQDGEAARKAGRELALSVLRVGESAALVEVRVTASPLARLVTDEEAEPSRAVTLPAGRNVTGELSIPLPARAATETRWRLHAAAPGFWSGPVTVGPDDAEPARLILWPATTLSAKLSHGGEPAEVDRLGIVLETDTGTVTADDPQPSGGVEIECPVRGGQVAGCTIPRGRWHLRLSAAGFAPRTVWNVRVDAAEPIDLGSVALVRGGSVYGRVVTGEGPAAPGTAEVSLTPLVSERGELASEDASALERMTRTAGIGADGQFEIVGVPEGLFVVEATEPGFAPARRSPVEVTSGEWTALEEPLHLEPLLQAVVAVRPATDPLGEPWTVELYGPLTESPVAAAGAGEAGAEGAWRSPPLAAGRYAVQVLDSRGSRFSWREEELIDDGSHEVRIEVDLPLVFVEGEVTLRNAPLAARLLFERRTEGGGSPETESDEEGRFYVVLPDEGEWEVFVRSDEPTVAVRGLPVEVEARGEEREARVTIEVPDTRISGAVVDRKGRPPASTARIEVLPTEADGRPTFAWADAEGRFELNGLRPGAYTVAAAAGEVRSDPSLVDVAEDLETSLRLVLAPRRTIDGRVVADSGPVAGAEILAFERAGPTKTPEMLLPQAVTGLDGRFRLQVRAGTERFVLVTRANGYALDIEEGSVAEGDETEIVLSRDGGVLRLPEPSAEPDEDGTVPVILVGGIVFGVPDLATWARTQGAAPGADGSLLVPGMPPEAYARCRLRPREALLVFTGAALPSAEACTEGFLAPGGELTLDPPH